jgi:hypothetical protein
MKPKPTNPHVYGAGTRLSSAYTIGRDGKPCPRYCAERTSAAHRAWKLGHDEFVASREEQPPARCRGCGAQAADPNTADRWYCPDCLDAGADVEEDTRDEAYERAAHRARGNDFRDTGGKDWT